ncbi:PilX N-terminal [Dethiosulfatibacter aminovorans DSM 17477]|uniref:PilX N-terminal n=1 Tax=Dethiosulfatibacter aminovorans DSM 17477 TaxID=1121476 RepID=A0A1M6D850_9FIRM|nr:PilX N-terminal domain-containing pilus assembly protein [Dethiosulfatibacter aminovorans]SHI69330.1 PilX N-terminal [Dethiosulfatibacter aminovorans DSM 17477]
MIRNEKGSTMVMLILILAILSLFGIVLMNTSVNENRNAIKEHDYQQAYFYARAGAAATADYFYRNPKSKDELEDDYLLGEGDDLLENKPTVYGNGSFVVGVMPTGTTDLIVKSVGTYNGIDKTVMALLERDPPFGNDAAIVVDNELVFDDGVVTGKMIIDSDGEYSIKRPQVDYDENNISRKYLDYEVYVVDESPESYDLVADANFDVKILNQKLTGMDKKEDIFTANDDLEFDCRNVGTGSEELYVGTYLGNVNFGNKNLTFKINNNGVDNVPELYFQHLYGAGSIDLEGSGKIIIRLQSAYITCDILSHEDDGMFLVTTYKDIDPNEWRNYEDGEIVIKTGDQGAENLFIFAPDKSVYIEASGGLHGAIIADYVEITSDKSHVHYEVPPYSISGEEIGNEKYTYSVKTWTEE